MNTGGSSNLLPANAPGQAADDYPGALTHASLVGHLDGALVSWLLTQSYLLKPLGE